MKTETKVGIVLFLMSLVIVIGFEAVLSYTDINSADVVGFLHSLAEAHADAGYPLLK
jgi:hypothetical protein